LSRGVRFGTVGISGLLVNQFALWSLVALGDINYLVAAIVATQCSTAWNFALVEVWAFRPRRLDGLWRRFAQFVVLNNGALLMRIPLLALLTGVFGIHYLLSNLITLVVLFVCRFALSDGLIWREEVA
jgi:dolichol-phosphate mannosyltransferase